MPTYASARYPKPTSWDEFEDICLSSFKTRWTSPNLQRHGRQGQAQQGVDIYGQDNFSSLVGIQCKNTVNGISEAVVDSEIAEAEKFSPPLRNLYIATTADTDAPLQAYVRNLSQARAQAGNFTVDIVFWDAIEHDLAADPKEIAKHYPHFFQSVPKEIAKHDPQFVQPVPVATGNKSPLHNRDVQTLIRLLSVIDIEATSTYLEYAPKYVNINFLEHTHNISAILHSPTFHIYDPDLKSNLDSWLKQWTYLANLIRNTPAYNLLPHSGDTLSFYMPGDFISDPALQEKYERIEEGDREFFRLQSVFCDFVRTHFMEVDLSQTSQTARQLY